MSCTSESCVDTETHGKGGVGGGVWCSGGKDQTRPDQTRRTPSNPGNRTAPQIKMQPGHSICVPLPSSPHSFSRSASTLMANGGGGGTFPARESITDSARVPLAEQNPGFATRLRRWREKGAATCTYPDQREQSWASSYTRVALASPVKRVWRLFYTEER